MWGYVAIAVLISISYSLAQDGIEEILTRMPKLEMHAHLHGSVRRSTLIELAALANMSTAMKTSLNQYDHGVADRPFELFPIVHSIVTSKQVVRRIVLEMIEDYQQQNCIYLEIRTTPRSLPDGTTMAEYLSLITELIAEHNVRAADRMLVKLIVSIDRSKKFAEAQEALELAKSYMYAHEQKVIVGVDFSGNPLGGRFDDFVSIFQSARASGLNITIHTAEMRALSEPVDHEDRDETEAILSFGPDRLGHLLYPMDRHFTQVCLAPP